LTDNKASSTAATSSNIGHQFMCIKNQGGLIRASASVIKVCEEAERCFQRMHAVVGDQLPKAQNLLLAICTVVLTEVGATIFEDLNEHMFDSTPDNNHVFTLVKCVAFCYSTIRVHHMAKHNSVPPRGKIITNKIISV